MMKTMLLFAAAILTAGCSTAPAPATEKPAAVGSIVRLDPSFDALVPKDAQIEKLAGGFAFTEGPVWRPSGVLWFSDVVGNVVRQWSPDGKVTEILKPGGYDGHDLPAGGFVGPNGATADKDGAVLLCQHGNRRIVRIGKDMQVTTLVDKFEGKRFNSPNDLVFRSDGSLFFTDPPYGLPKDDSDPAKELNFNGVFRLANGKLQAIVKDARISARHRVRHQESAGEERGLLRQGRRNHRRQSRRLETSEAARGERPDDPVLIAGTAATDRVRLEPQAVFCACGSRRPVTQSP